MIIQNGYIERITISGGGLDAATGHPLAGTKAYGSPIPCQYVSASKNMLAKSNDEPVSQMSWTIYVEALCRRFSIGERVRLTDLCGNEIDEYSVIRAIPLEAVCQIVLTV